MGSKVIIEWEDADGAWQKREQPFRSFTKNFIRTIRGCAWGSSSKTWVHTGEIQNPSKVSNGAPANYPAINSNKYYIPAFSTSNEASGYKLPHAGIVVATGTDPVQNGNYNMPGFISDGIDTGYLKYDDLIKTGYNETENSFVFYRYFKNLSGASIVIGSTGLYGIESDSNSWDYYVMLARDVLDTPLSLANNKRLKITYKFSFLNDTKEKLTRNFLRDAYYGLTARNYNMRADKGLRNRNNADISSSPDIRKDAGIFGFAYMWQAACCISYPNAGLRVGSNDSADGYKDAISDTEVDILDYDLRHMIGNGSGDGQLIYRPIEMDSAVETDTTSEWKFRREFWNNGSIAVNIGELGLFLGNDGYSSGRDGEVFMIYRKILDTPIVVEPGDCALIEMSFKTTT